MYVVHSLFFYITIQLRSVSCVLTIKIGLDWIVEAKLRDV